MYTSNHIIRILVYHLGIRNVRIFWKSLKKIVHIMEYHTITVHVEYSFEWIHLQESLQIKNPQKTDQFKRRRIRRIVKELLSKQIHFLGYECTLVYVNNIGILVRNALICMIADNIYFICSRIYFNAILEIILISQMNNNYGDNIHLGLNLGHLRNISRSIYIYFL